MILGKTFSDCDQVAHALADHQPVIGTFDMVMGALRAVHFREGLVDEQETLAGPRGKVKLSLGEWIVTTGRKGLLAKMDAHQLAQVVAIDANANWIDVVRQGEVARLQFRNDPAIRPAAAISIRDAWDAPSDAKLVIELADPRRVWAGLLLAANLNRIARLQLLLQSRDDLGDLLGDAAEVTALHAGVHFVRWLNVRLIQISRDAVAA